MGAARDNRLAELAKIHIAKKQLGMDDDTYRAVLLRVTGQSSAADLNAGERRRLLDCFRSLGFEPRESRRQHQGAHSRKIRALWLELDKLGALRDASERGLAAFVKRQTGIEALDWLGPEQRNVVLEGLKGWLERARRKAAAGQGGDG